MLATGVGLALLWRCTPALAHSYWHARFGDVSGIPHVPLVPVWLFCLAVALMVVLGLALPYYWDEQWYRQIEKEQREERATLSAMRQATSRRRARRPT